MIVRLRYRDRGKGTPADLVSKGQEIVVNPQEVHGGHKKLDKFSLVTLRSTFCGYLYHLARQSRGTTKLRTLQLEAIGGSLTNSARTLPMSPHLVCSSVLIGTPTDLVSVGRFTHGEAVVGMKEERLGHRAFRVCYLRSRCRWSERKRVKEWECGKGRMSLLCICGTEMN